MSHSNANRTQFETALVRVRGARREHTGLIAHSAVNIVAVVVVIATEIAVVVVVVVAVVVVVVVVTVVKVRHARNSRKCRLNVAAFWRFLSNGSCAPTSLYSTHTIFFVVSLECANPLHAHVLRHCFAHANSLGTTAAVNCCRSPLTLSTPLELRKRPFVFSSGS